MEQERVEDKIEVDCNDVDVDIAFNQIFMLIHNYGLGQDRPIIKKKHWLSSKRKITIVIRGTKDNMERFKERILSLA